VSYFRSLAAKIYRLGREADVFVRTETGEDRFGNPTDDFTKDRTVLAARTYPNRNSDVTDSSGTRHEDEPVFMVPKGPDQPPVPGEGDRIKYDGVTYEVGSHTPYDTHIEFFGQVIHNDEGANQ
jgi:hypothetical protein